MDWYHPVETVDVPSPSSSAAIHANLHHPAPPIGSYLQGRRQLVSTEDSGSSGSAHGLVTVPSSLGSYAGTASNVSNFSFQATAGMYGDYVLHLTRLYLLMLLPASDPTDSQVNDVLHHALAILRRPQ